MPLHYRDDILDDLNDDIYANSDLSVSMPKYKMPAQPQEPRHAYQIVHDELMLDGNARQNLATFCQTWVDDSSRVNQRINPTWCADRYKSAGTSLPATGISSSGRCRWNRIAW